jgi:fatty aldehyde-generating acyl-ACP reductase
MMPLFNNFGFILTPVTVSQLKSVWPIVRLVPGFIIKSSAWNLPSPKISRIRWVRSGRGSEIEGYLIICPLLRRKPEEIKESLILDKIIAAGQALQRLGCAILGIGGCGSILSPQAYSKIAQNLKIPVTSGNALTAWTVIEALYRAARIKRIALQGLKVAIIGNDSCIGRLCALKLSECGLEVNKGGSGDMDEADIVINAADKIEELIDIKDLRAGAIFCDVSLSILVNKAKLRDDITVIEAGLVKLPSAQIVSAAMAETMLLAFERRFVNYSDGDNLNPDKLEEIADIAAWHGFEVYVPEAPAL